MTFSVRATAAAAVVVLGLSGCQASSSDLSTATAEQFQSRVLSITTSVADGDHAAAMDAVTTLETELDAAAQDGSVSFPRHQRIEAALGLVRADIQAALDAAAPEPEPEPAPAPAPEPEPEPVTPTPPVNDDDDDEGDDEGDGGNGNGNGNGNGKDKDKRDNPKKNNGNGKPKGKD